VGEAAAHGAGLKRGNIGCSKGAPVAVPRITLPAAGARREAQALSVSLTAKEATLVRFTNRRAVFDGDEAHARCKQQSITAISIGIRLFQG
jgi:hypothetical protein